MKIYIHILYISRISMELSTRQSYEIHRIRQVVATFNDHLETFMLRLKTSTAKYPRYKCKKIEIRLINYSLLGI